MTSVLAIGSWLAESRLRFHLYRGQIRAILGDADAGQDLRIALLEAERLALPAYGARAALFLGDRLFWRGRDEEAQARYREAVELATAAGDRLGEATARCQLQRLGNADRELADIVREVDVPGLWTAWLLALAAEDRALPDTEARLDQILQNADLPFPLHLRALTWLERGASARTLVRQISQRLPERSMRKRFEQFWPRNARP